MSETQVNNSALGARRIARAVGCFGFADPEEAIRAARAAQADRPTLDQFEDRFSHPVARIPRAA